MDLMDEIYGAYKRAYGEKGDKPNTVIIPSDREYELYKTVNDYMTPGVYMGKSSKAKVFDCDIIFSANTREIKAGFLL